MSKRRDKVTQQLELRLLTDINAKSEAKGADTATTRGQPSGDASWPDGATEKDKSVYRQMANNYFDSLRKE